MRVMSLLAVSLVGVLGVAPAAIAVRQADGTVSFEASPRLLSATTTIRGVSQRGAKYYFTVAVPETAGEPLETVTLTKRSGTSEIDYELDRTFAFVGSRRDRERDLPLAAVDYDEEAEVVTVVLAEPVAPGETFTVGLRPRRNPRFGGTYLFAVEVFPRGEKTLGLNLGVGRLQFIENDGFDFHLFK